MVFVKYVIALVFSFSSALWAGTCDQSFITLGANSTKQNQEITLDDVRNHKIFYYKIHVDSDYQTLAIQTQIDASNPSDTVDTYVDLLDASCTPISTKVRKSFNPYNALLTQTLKQGDYYLRVKTAPLDGGRAAYLTGFFQVKNSLSAPLKKHEIKVNNTGATQVNSNQNFRYYITVTNSGWESTSAVHIESILPAEVTYLSSSSGWNCTQTGQTLGCDFIAGTLAGLGSSTTLTLYVQANTSTVDVDTTNIANVQADYSDGDFKIASDTHRVIILKIIPQPASVYLQKSAEIDGHVVTEVQLGKTFNYILQAVNLSYPDDITNLHLVDDIDPAFSILFIDNKGVWDCNKSSGQHVECDYNASLASYNGTGIVVEVQAVGATPSTIPNTATVTAGSASGAISDSASYSINLIPKQAKLIFSEKKSSKNPVDVNESFDYRVKIKNVSDDVNATNVKVQFDLDSSLEFVDMNASDWNCTGNNGGSVYTCVLNMPLNVGIESPPILLSVKSPRVADTITTLKLSSDETNVPKKAYIVVDVFHAFSTNLTLKMSTDDETVIANDSYIYNLDIYNSSSSDIAGLRIDINTTSADNFTLLSVDAADWYCRQTTKQIRCTINDVLSANAVSSIALHVKAPNKTTTVDVVGELMSEHIMDTNLADNKAQLSTEIFKYGSFNVNNLRPFSKTNIAGSDFLNIHGDVITIGNQALCLGGNTGTCKEPNDSVNDRVFQTRANLDSIKVYDTSTMANLDIKPSDEVLWAGLYWMGMIDRAKGDAAKIPNADKVYLRHDSNSTYTKVKTNPLKFNWHNDNSFGVDIFAYQCVKDVTSYVQKYRDGKYWVSDVKTSEGYNLSAGWSLVVVVHDKAITPTRDLKNITVFDGFQAVWKNDYYSDADQYPNSVTQRVDGFVTPKLGAVKSRVSYFALEGDLTLNDSISLTDNTNTPVYLPTTPTPLNVKDDVLNGTVTNPIREPLLANTSGVDIDTFDVSSVLGNGQSSSDITIYSQGDRFYLGMFNFSTNMYLPRICYDESMTQKDYSPLLDRIFEVDEPIGFDVFIKNEEDEPARETILQVQVDKLFADTNKTFEIQNTNETVWQSITTPTTNNIEINASDMNQTNDKNETVPQTTFKAFVGIGADKSHGGKLHKNDIVHVRFNGRIDGIPDSNLTKNIYKVSFDVNYTAGKGMKILDAEIKPCGVVNNTIEVQKYKPVGFDVTHYGGLPNHATDGDTPQCHLYTQLANTDFIVDVVSLEKLMKVSRAHKGVVRLDLVDASSGGSCESYSIIESKMLNFSDEIRQSPTVRYHHAYQNVRFRVQYPVDIYDRYAKWGDTDISGINALHNLNDMLFKTFRNVNYPCKSACVSNVQTCKACVFSPDNHLVSRVSCSRDVFAIRPSTVQMDANETKLKGGKNYTLALDANASGYTQTLPSSALTYALSKPASCALATDTGNVSSSSLSFVDGNASVVDFHYHDIGDINVTFHDNTWTGIDQNASDSSMSDCIVGSSNNTPIAGKYGCDVKADNQFSFVADRFENSVDLVNYHDKSFTYLDASGTQRARAKIRIKALLADGNTAINYTAGCYAHDINYTFGPLNAILNAPAMKIYSDANASKVSANQFETLEGNFSSGLAHPVLGINFARSKVMAINPVEVNSSNLYIAIEDTQGLEGDGFSNATGDALYYYARLYAPDYVSIVPSTFKAALSYEVYFGDGCDKSSVGLSGLFESEDYVNWYFFNAQHNDVALGDYSSSSLHADSGLSVLASGVKAVDLNLSTAIKRPYCSRVSLKPDPWLQYDKYTLSQAKRLHFKACFVSEGVWSR